MFPVGREALEVLARGLVHGGVAHPELLEEPLGLHDLFGQRLRLRLVPPRPLVPLLLDVVPVGDLTKRIAQTDGNFLYKSFGIQVQNSTVTLTTSGHGVRVPVSKSGYIPSIKLYV